MILLNGALFKKTKKMEDLEFKATQQQNNLINQYFKDSWLYFVSELDLSSLSKNIDQIEQEIVSSYIQQWYDIKYFSKDHLNQVRITNWKRIWTDNSTIIIYYKWEILFCIQFFRNNLNYLGISIFPKIYQKKEIDEQDLKQQAEIFFQQITQDFIKKFNLNQKLTSLFIEIKEMETVEWTKNYKIYNIFYKENYLLWSLYFQDWIWYFFSAII